MRPLFTIGIPVFNAMPYLPEALDSVLGQTYPYFELLVINDGSRDGSLEYLRSLSDPRLRIIAQENRGLTATLNRMLEDARAPWLVRLDADDVCCPERLATILGALELHPGAGMFYSRACLYGHPRSMASARATEGTPAELRHFTRSGYLLAIVHSSVVLNVAKTRALGGYRFDLHIEDLDLWWRMALRHDVVFLPQVTVHHRLNHTSICINNLQRLSANTLFAQYLLLSHLWELEPQPYKAVIGALSHLVDSSRLVYREEMWRAAADLGSGRYCQAAPYLFRAALHSPACFLRRITYPFRREPAVRLGEDPAQFRRIARQLWPLEELSNRAFAFEPA
ncbi:MAG TPA: glycosyltransferase family 2 protein [Terriglobales bacterium]|nr:glycosyltransferase family 2 protein [Terriglobales bacterium]